MLIIATKNDHEGVVQLLLDAGANVNFIDDERTRYTMLLKVGTKIF